MGSQKIGLSMLYCLDKSFNAMVEHIPKAETKWIEIVDDGFHELNKRRVTKLNEMAKSYGIAYAVHAPFAGVNIALPSKTLLNAALRRLKKSISNASDLNAKMWIFHPGLKTGISTFYPDADWKENLESVRLLFKFASDRGVRIGIENLPKPFSFLLENMEHFKKFYEEIDEDVGLVLDTGHAYINGQLEDFLVGFADKIVHVHAHDNNGETDQHLGVGFGNINWVRTADLLKKSRFDGIVSVESVEHVEESIQKLKHLLLS